MRLLFVIQKLNYAGTSTYALDLATELRKAGNEVRLCTTGGKLRAAFTEAEIETYVVRSNPFSYWQLLGFLREFHPHLVHIQNLRSAPLGRKLARKLRIPHLVTVHRTPAAGAPQPLAPGLAGIIALNEVVREALVNDHGVPKSMVRVVPRGVNTDLLTPDRAAPDGAEGDMIPVVGSIGNLARVKGHHVFLKAARRVLDAGVEALFAIVGEGDDEGELRSIVKELRLEPHVTFSPPVPSRRELYRTFDIVVVPTLRGGVGSTALEAMSMAKPVITTAVGETLHIVEDHKTGLLVPEGDEVVLAERMVELLRDAGLRRALGDRAREYVVQGFALPPMVNATREYYAEILARMSEER